VPEETTIRVSVSQISEIKGLLARSRGNSAKIGELAGSVTWLSSATGPSDRRIFISLVHRMIASM
jgi:hypothetical protein